MSVTVPIIESVAQSILRRNCQLSDQSRTRIFRANFGVSPYICAVVWNELVDTRSLPQGARPKHILWSLLFLKVYATENVLCTICACDEKTFRKWVWLLVAAMARLVVVSV
jgi:hypothetical protein